MKVRNILLVALLVVTGRDFIHASILEYVHQKDFTDKNAFQKVGSKAAPTLLTKTSFDPENTGIALLISGDDASKESRIYTLSNPYNKVYGWEQTSDQLQPFAKRIQQLPHSDKTNNTWGVYIAPYFVSQKTGHVITDLSTISDANPAIVKALLIDSFGNIYGNYQVSFDNPTGPSNSLNNANKPLFTSKRNQHVTFPVKNVKIMIQTGRTQQAFVTLGKDEHSFAISPFQNIVNNMVALANKNFTKSLYYSTSSVAKRSAQDITKTGNMYGVTGPKMTALGTVNTLINQIEQSIEDLKKSLPELEKDVKAVLAQGKTASATTPKTPETTTPTASATTPKTPETTPRTPAAPAQKVQYTLEELLAEGKSKRTAEAILRKQKLMN